MITNTTLSNVSINQSAITDPIIAGEVFAESDTYISYKEHIITLDEIITKLGILDRIISQDYPEFII